MTVGDGDCLVAGTFMIRLLMLCMRCYCFDSSQLRAVQFVAVWVTT